MPSQAKPQAPAVQSATAPEWYLPKIEKHFARLATRAKKLGMPAPTCRVVGDFEAEGGAIFVRLEVWGAVPVLEGWEILGIVSRVTKDHAVVLSAPGVEIPEGFRDRPNVCEHCKTKRARKETLILRGPDGELRQIGKSCAADYLGDAETAKALAERWKVTQAAIGFFFDGDPGEDHGGPRGYCDPSVVRFVRAAAYWTALRGYEKANAAISTRELALAACSNDPHSIRICQDHGMGKPVEIDTRETAEKALAWIRGLEGDALRGDYMRNLHAAAHAIVASRRVAGLLASLPGAYLRAVDKAASLEAARERAAKFDSKPLGEVGERLDFTATIERWAVRGDADSGFYTRISMRTPEGDAVLWNASGDHVFTPGAVFKVRGTVRGTFTDRAGEIVTKVNRCVMAKIDPAGRA